MKKTLIRIPTNERCLIVEDSEARNDWFREKLPESIICTNPHEATVELVAADQYGYRFGIVFLDHDCVPRFVEHEEPEYRKLTFWAVAEYLAVKKFAGIVVIHSGNPVGAKRMADLLESAGVLVSIIPFGMFDIAEA
jgi:hypothetical protein